MRDNKRPLSLIPGFKEAPDSEKKSLALLKAECLSELIGVTDTAFENMHRIAFSQSPEIVLAEQPTHAYDNVVDTAAYHTARATAVKPVAVASHLDASRANVANAYGDSQDPYAPAA